MKNRGKFLLFVLAFAFSLILFSLSISFVSAGQLKVTQEHPFLINGEWIPASELKVGYNLTTIEGKNITIKSIKDIETTEPFFVYNIEDDFGINNFVVGGDGGVVVHNSNLPTISNINLFRNIRTVDQQTDFLVRNLAPLSSDSSLNREAMSTLLDTLYSIDPGATIVFGGSRVSGSFTPRSDIDVGFYGLKKEQITSYRNRVNKKLNKLLGTSGRMYVEHTYIYPGSQTRNVVEVLSPEEFFSRFGIRTDGPKEGQLFFPSRWIKMSKIGTLKKNLP